MKRKQKENGNNVKSKIFYFLFYIYCANFVRIGPQIKKFSKKWVGPLKQNKQSFKYHLIKFTLI